MKVSENSSIFPDKALGSSHKHDWINWSTFVYHRIAHKSRRKVMLHYLML